MTYALLRSLRVPGVLWKQPREPGRSSQSVPPSPKAQLGLFPTQAAVQKIPSRSGKAPDCQAAPVPTASGSSGGLECQRQFCRGPSGNPPHTKAPRPSELSARTASATLCPEAALQTPGPKAPAAPHSPPKNLTDTTSSSMRKMCCAFLVLGISLASRRKEIWWEGTDS